MSPKIFGPSSFCTISGLAFCAVGGVFVAGFSADLGAAENLVQLKVDTSLGEARKDSPPFRADRDDRGLPLRQERALSGVVGQAPVLSDGASKVGLPLRFATGLAEVGGAADGEAGAEEVGGTEAVALAGDGAVKQPGPSAKGAVAEPSSKGIFGSGWAIPPVRWGGATGYNLSRSSSSGGGSSASHGMFLNLQTSSYIYAPWLATVSGRTGITQSVSSSGGTVGGSAVSSASGQNQSTTVTGGWDVSMFNRSRFPLRTYFDRSDSRSGGMAVSTDYTNTRFGLRQNFRLDDGFGSGSGSVSLDRSTIETSAGNQDGVTSMAGNFSNQTGIVRNGFSGAFSRTQRSPAGDTSQLLNFNSTHSAELEDNMNVSGNLGLSTTSFHMPGVSADGTGAVASSDSRSRFIVMGLTGNWLPEFEELDDLPLSLTGGLRYYGSSTEFGGNAAANTVMGGNLGAAYRFSRNLSMSANGAINQVSSSVGASQMSTQYGAGINYTGDPLTFGKFSYSWGGGGNANWFSLGGNSTSASNSATYGGNASHSLMYFQPLSSSETISLSLSQSLGVMQGGAQGVSTTLSHGVSTGYGLRISDQFSGNLSATLSDNITTGTRAMHYRSLSLGAFAQGQLSQRSSLFANLSFNWSGQDMSANSDFGSGLSASKSQSTSIAGSVAYQVSRFLGVRGMNYGLQFNVDTRTRDTRFLGDASGAFEPLRTSWINRLDYRVGLMDLRLSATLNDTGGKKNALLFFQATRQIGMY